MSLFSRAVSDGEAIALNAVPGLRGARLAVISILTLAAIAAVGFAFWWIFIHPGQVRQQAKQAEVGGVMAKAGTMNAGDALKITLDVKQHEAAIDQTTRENAHAILSAPGAQAVADPAVAVALAHAFCMRDAFRSDGDRAALCPAGGGIGPAGGDPAGAAAARDRGGDDAPDAH